MYRKMFLAIAVLAGSVAVLGPPSSASPLQDDSSPSCDTRTNNTLDKLLECVTIDGVRAHQAAFQAAADANGGTREASSAGYAASGQYVADLMAGAGYDVTIQEFEYPYFEELAPAELQQVAPVPTDYPYFDVAGFATMSYSGSGDVTAPTAGVDLALGTPDWPADPSSSTSGCEAADFAGFPAGAIAVVQRGACNFSVKAVNAEAAGAVGVIIFNQGNGPGRVDAFVGTLGGPVVSVPVVGANFNVGAELAGTGVIARMFTSTVSETRTTFNVLAETTGGDPDNVVMVGAHLDSVAEGPGIQDNGSGSAAILETALQMAKVTPRNQVRFAWWGAEEAGLLGSQHYVDQLTVEEQAQIALYLNFDMIGSPNHFFGVYDGDESTFDQPDGFIPAGSAQIEDTFERYYDADRHAVPGHGLLRALGLRAVHRRGHPRRGPVHRRRGDQDPRGGRPLRRHRRGAVRPVLPPVLRHLRQHQPRGAGDEQRCRRLRHAHLCHEHRGRERCAGQGQLPAGGLKGGRSRVGQPVRLPHPVVVPP